jgi:hypothetical protein
VVARGMRHRAYFQDMARSYLVKFSPS